MENLDVRSTESRKILDLRTLGFKDVLVLGNYKYKEVQPILPMHQHKGMIEICFLDKGTQHYVVDSKKYILRGGDILVTLPGLFHGTSSYHEEKGSLYWMIIKIPEEEESLLNLSKSESDLLINKLFDLPSIHFRGKPEMRSILKNIYTTFGNNRDLLGKIKITKCLLEFLLEVIYCGEHPAKNGVSPLIKFVSDYIMENYSENLTIDMMASKIDLSPSHFKHRFKNEMGIPPAEYLVRARIENSLTLLKDTSLSIADIAYKTGFTSPSYFATAFKRLTGKTPSNSRK